MATTRHLDSNATGAANGTSWTDAYTTMAAVDAVDAAGDTILCSYLHSDPDPGANSTWTFAGTITSPTTILSVDPADDSLRAGALFTTTTTHARIINGNLYAYGLNFSTGSGANNTPLKLGPLSTVRQHWDTCSFTQPETSGGSNLLGIGDNATIGSITFTNCTVTQNAPCSFFLVGSARFEWLGGTATASSSNPNGFLQGGINQRNSDILIQGVDLSSLPNISLILASTLTPAADILFKGCKMPAAFSLVNAAPSYPGMNVRMESCDSGATNYRLWHEQYQGTTKSETTYVKDSGGSDGTTQLAYSLAVNANGGRYPFNALEGPELEIWNDATGSPIDVVVDIESAVTLKDNEVWLDVWAMESASSPLYTRHSSRVAPRTTAADVETSSATWAGSLASAVKQKLTVTVTPALAGPIFGRVYFAYGSAKTLYHDGVLQGL